MTARRYARLLPLAVAGLLVVLWAVTPARSSLATGADTPGPAVMVTSAEAKIDAVGEVKLKALAIPEPGLGAWTIDIHYNPEAVNVLACEPYKGSVCNLDFADGTVRVSGSNVEGLVGYNYLAALAVGCKAAGASELTLTVDTLVDATAGEPQPIDADVINGKVACFAHEDPKPTDEPKPTGEPKKDDHGDANCDDSVDPVDATLVLQHHVDLIDELPCEGKADMNEDEKVDSIDALVILDKCAGLLD